jgi:hypothetical protein
MRHAYNIIIVLYIIIIYNDISFADLACKRKRFQPNELTIIICAITTLNQYYGNDSVFIHIISYLQP